MSLDLFVRVPSREFTFFVSKVGKVQVDPIANSTFEKISEVLPDFHTSNSDKFLVELIHFLCRVKSTGNLITRSKIESFSEDEFERFARLLVKNNSFLRRIEGKRITKRHGESFVSYCQKTFSRHLKRHFRSKKLLKNIWVNQGSLGSAIAEGIQGPNSSAKELLRSSFNYADIFGVKFDQLIGSANSASKLFKDALAPYEKQLKNFRNFSEQLSSAQESVFERLGLSSLHKTSVLLNELTKSYRIKNNLFGNSNVSSLFGAGASILLGDSTLALSSILGSLEYNSIKNIFNTIDQISISELVDNENEFYLDEAEIEAASEEIDKKASSNDFKKYSDAAQKLLRLAIIHLIMPTIIMFFGMLIQAKYMVELQEFFNGNTGKEEIIKCAKNLPEEFDRDLISSCRVIIGDNLRLRINPNLNAEILSLIPIGTIVDVIEKSSDKLWFYVYVTIDDEKQEGWVYKSFTTKLK